MDSELRDFLENFARAFDRKFEKLEAELHELRRDMHDLREEMRAVRADLREQSQRIGNVSTGLLRGSAGARSPYDRPRGSGQ